MTGSGLVLLEILEFWDRGFEGLGLSRILGGSADFVLNPKP